METGSVKASTPLEDRIREELINSGEHDRLAAILRDKLVQCGWRDDLKLKCLEVVKQRGRENVTLEDLARAIGPAGRASVPDSVKAELLAVIKQFIQTLS